MFQFPSSPIVDYKQLRIDLAKKKQKELEKAKRLMESEYSISDGYDYEPFDDAYDEGFSLSEDGFGDDGDAWEDMFDGEGFSVEDAAADDEYYGGDFSVEDAWDDAYEGEGFSVEDAYDEELEDAADD
ncbi:hypothetical protein GGF32_002673 [Allomyces javanicus]|nr:hypothetical protein GGF32_002673 [Allomyces javanicus]